MIRFILFVIFLSSCSSVTYTGDGDRPIHISKHANKEVVELKAEHEIQNMFYGNIPKKHTVKLGNDFYKKRSRYISRVEISQIETTYFQFLKFLSLGLFSKQVVETKAVADMGQNEYEVYE